MAEPEELHEDDQHLPPPTLWPIGFAIGVVVILVGLVISPKIITPIGVVIAVVFGFLWARDATSELRGQHIEIEPEQREADVRDAEPLPATEPGERFPRSKFLEASTLGLGAVIGGIVTVPVAGFALLPPFLAQKQHRVDLGPISDFPEGQWFVATFITDVQEGETARRTAFVRNNGTATVDNQPLPSFTLISNRCAHLGCPVQANGPLGKKREIKTLNGPVSLLEAQPAGFGCPCHGGQYDTEGNRTAGPPTHALDRYSFEINHGRLILLSMFGVSFVEGQGASAQIHKYRYGGPGVHYDGPEQVLYPLFPPHN